MAHHEPGGEEWSDCIGRDRVTEHPAKSQGILQFLSSVSGDKRPSLLIYSSHLCDSSNPMSLRGGSDTGDCCM